MLYVDYINSVMYENKKQTEITNNNTDQLLDNFVQPNSFSIVKTKKPINRIVNKNICDNKSMIIIENKITETIDNSNTNIPQTIKSVQKKIKSPIIYNNHLSLFGSAKEMLVRNNFSNYIDTLNKQIKYLDKYVPMQK